MTDTTPTLAEQIANGGGHLRLWDGRTVEFVWSNSTEPPEDRLPLLDVLAEREGWTLATLDHAERGRVWSGRMRVDENGDIEARPESEFLAGIILPVNPAVAPEAGSNDE